MYNKHKIKMKTPEIDKQILYLTDNGKLGVLKGNKGWDFHSEKYCIRRWWYADEVIDTMISIALLEKLTPGQLIKDAERS